MTASGVRFVYIASNHASHTAYAREALELGLAVYIEKPVSVSFDQLTGLRDAIARSHGHIVSGYNRPHSPALRDLRRWCSEPGPATIACSVFAHDIAPTHWYRQPQEGTRICGNVGHWIDMALHIVQWHHRPRSWSLHLTASDTSAPDDNLVLTLVSDLGDLISICISSRSEPFEGIRESIAIQIGPTSSIIHDFRTMTVWRHAKKRSYRYWPKNVGHEANVLQLVRGVFRDWSEVDTSTRIMLLAADMASTGRSQDKLTLTNP